MTDIVQKLTVIHTDMTPSTSQTWNTRTSLVETSVKELAKSKNITRLIYSVEDPRLWLSTLKSKDIMEVLRKLLQRSKNITWKRKTERSTVVVITAYLNKLKPSLHS